MRVGEGAAVGAGVVLLGTLALSPPASAEGPPDHRADGTVTVQGAPTHRFPGTGARPGAEPREASADAFSLFGALGTGRPLATGAPAPTRTEAAASARPTRARRPLTPLVLGGVGVLLMAIGTLNSHHHRHH